MNWVTTGNILNKGGRDLTHVPGPRPKSTVQRNRKKLDFVRVSEEIISTVLVKVSYVRCEGG